MSKRKADVDMLMFRDIFVGDEFDFGGPNEKDKPLRCVKISERRYRDELGNVERIGGGAAVFNVKYATGMAVAAEAILKDLKREAMKSCRFRGHKMKRWNTFAYDITAGRYTAISECSECGADVCVDTRPEPNGIDIGGEAVAVGCHKKEKKENGLL